jgi:DNA-directed RNA polymerase specialized sigma24 family protein
MARHSEIQPDSLDEILSWLNPDRELSPAIYVQLRQDLEKIFVWRNCSDPEGMTDEVFDRVARKIQTLKLTYKGDPRLYFRGVANNLVKENLKKIKTHVSLEDVDLSQRQMSESEQDILHMEECLQSCLQKLRTENRELVLAYYAKQKQAKINHRNGMAQQLGISVETLRVRVFRIRVSLEDCIERCLKSRGQEQ